MITTENTEGTEGTEKTFSKQVLVFSVPSVVKGLNFARA
jgi:hypothetical protein